RWRRRWWWYDDWLDNPYSDGRLPGRGRRGGYDWGNRQRRLEGRRETLEEVEGKRVYRITESGRAFLEEHRDRAEDVADRVSDFAERFTGRAMRDVTRSFVRLAQTSFDRAVRYAARDPEAMTELRDILDRAADEVEAWSQRSRERRRGSSGSAEA
ncbi:MAG: hypothetical protein P8099_19635, partial [Gemmatimonadota bacterium]